MSHTGSQQCLSDWTPVKTLAAKAPVSFLVGNTLHVVAHGCWKKLAVSVTQPGREMEVAPIELS